MLRPLLRRAHASSMRMRPALSEEAAATAADAPLPSAAPATHLHSTQHRLFSTTHPLAPPHSMTHSPAFISAPLSSSSALLFGRRTLHSACMRRGEEEDAAAKIAAHRERIRLKREADKAAAAAGIDPNAASADAEPPKPDVTTASSQSAPKSKKFSDEPVLDELAHRGTLQRMWHWLVDLWRQPTPDELKFAGVRREVSEFVHFRYPLFYASLAGKPTELSAEEVLRNLSLEKEEQGPVSITPYDEKFVRQPRPQPKKTLVKESEWLSEPLLRAKKAQEKAAREAKEKEEAEFGLPSAASTAPYTGPTALMVIKENDILWSARMRVIDEGMTEMIRRVTRPITRRLFAIEPIANMRNSIQERLAESREQWETSQDPRVWQVRDLQDRMAQTETSQAFTEIVAADPTFNEVDFLKEMEEFMIPEVITAYRVGDMKLLQGVADGPAAGQILSHIRMRAHEKRELDPRIIDIAGVDIVKASVAEDLPYIQLTFVCQHINRDTHSETGEVIEHVPKEGQVKQATGTVSTVYYSWALRRDYESKLYNWKIIDFQAQVVGMLA